MRTLSDLYGDNLPKGSLLEIAEKTKMHSEGTSYDELKSKIWPDLLKVIQSIKENINPLETRKKPNILVIGTGGTIMAGKGEKGLAPTGTIKDTFDKMNLPEGLPVNFQFLDLMCLDSSQIIPEQRNFLAEVIDYVYSNLKGRIDGIAIAHGTDTMPESARYITYMLENLPLPIVFFGSQEPATNSGSDASTNVQNMSTFFKKAFEEGCCEHVVIVGKHAVRASSVIKTGDKTTDTMRSGGILQLDPTVTEIRNAIANGTLHTLNSGYVMDFTTGRSLSNLTFEGNVITTSNVGRYSPFFKVKGFHNSPIIKLTDIDGKFLVDTISNTSHTVATLLGSSTSHDTLTKIVIEALKRGHLISVVTPFPDAEKVFKYAAGIGITEHLEILGSSVPIISTQPINAQIKGHVGISRLGIEFKQGKNGQYVDDVEMFRAFYDFMSKPISGDLVS